MTSDLCRSGSVFPQTKWTQVAAAADADHPLAAEALEDLCQQYWQPVFAVVRGSGHDVEAAKDLTQGFFARFLEKGWLEVADENKGRFRTFLVTALKRYLVNEWHRDHAAKRGGFEVKLPLDHELAERIGSENSGDSPEAMFDRRWALTLLKSAMGRLEEESGETFAVLKDTLTAGRGEIDYGAIAAELEFTEGAARVAVHRFRKRYRLMIRDEVARTVAEEGDVETEMQELFSALG